ncbi:hypothetical protein GF412_04745 [Candidatus Micrarchaeota archaeon]|nr:hypothetical protein [Candidatus Micrarchaeota archaeon]MBD3418261.1 hypothetical protein [Candidatus Micrarchaeota archaeon]
MVFGIGEGKIGMELNTHDVSSGGKISGRLRLELNSPKHAKELRVELIGEQRRTRRGKSRKEVVYRFKQVLDGEKEYTGGEYDFELQAPVKSELEKEMQEGAAGALLGAAKMLGAISPVEYYVVGTLDIPMSMDINKRVQIAVV